MYLTQRLNDVVALDATTGRAFWIYRYTPAADRIVCCGANNRGLAILGDTLFMGTLDAKLIAIDAKSGRQLWKTEVASHESRLLDHARAAGREGQGDRRRRRRRVRHPRLRRRLRRRTPARRRGASTRSRRPASPDSRPGSGARPTRPAFCDPEAWKHGGGSIWLTGSYDPQLNLTYWGVGNVGPDYNGAQRPGDNLYTDSVVALDADTGTLRWHYQFTPHDVYDYDSVQVPVLVDNWANTGINVMLWANRNGNFYVLDRATGRFLLGQAVREGELDERVRRARPADADAAAGRDSRRIRATRAARTGTRRRTARARVCSTSRRGRTTPASSRGRPSSTRKGPNFVGGGPRNFGPVPGAPGLGRAPDQHLDRSGRPRRGDRARSGDRRAEVEVRHDRRHRQRDPDDRVGSRSSRAAARATSRRSTRAPVRCCGRPTSAPRSTAAR